MNATLKQALNAMRTVNILIVGDVMLDRYVHGSVSRVSPEAPVGILAADQYEVRAGGAAGVAVFSSTFLNDFPEPIDVLYLDSLDTNEPGHAEHALREVQAAYRHLHAQSLVLFDDTPFGGNAFTGKGAVAVPWLLEQGWRLLYAGYQVLLCREDA